MADFFKYFALKTYGTLKMILLSVQDNFYTILSSTVEGRVQRKFKSEFHVLGWCPGLGNLNVLLEIFFLKSFSDRNSSLEPRFFLFLTVFHMVWKNQES